jgi:hypothetical protein
MRRECDVGDVEEMETEMGTGKALMVLLLNDDFSSCQNTWQVTLLFQFSSVHVKYVDSIVSSAAFVCPVTLYASERAVSESWYLAGLHVRQG